METTLLKQAWTAFHWVCIPAMVWMAVTDPTGFTQTHIIGTYSDMFNTASGFLSGSTATATAAATSGATASAAPIAGMMATTPVAPAVPVMPEMSHHMHH
jgi:hypothetical protein